MNDEAEYVHDEINRYIVLCRSTDTEIELQGYLDKLLELNLEYKKLCEEE